MASDSLARLGALLGISAYTPPPRIAGASLDDPRVIEGRAAYGGQLAPPPTTRTRWYQADLEAAEFAADQGRIETAAQLMRAARKDGVLAGVLSTRTGGLVRLPRVFRGDEKIVKELEDGRGDGRSVFDEMFPASELALLAGDGELLGVGVGELIPVAGRDFPVFVRLDPAFLVYFWSENRWYFRSIIGLIPITPGDGRWILHTPGGRTAPWQHGLWKAIGRAFIRKEHALMHKDNWEAKLANPARAAVAPQGASESQSAGWFESVLAWGVNTVFGMPPGYDVKIIESNGRGADSFLKTIADCNSEYVIALSGQTVTTDGGTGFANADIHKSIRADLIKATGDALAYTINTQGLPPWILARWGERALDKSTTVEWDVTPPKDRKAEADALQIAAQAITQLTVALAAHSIKLDAQTLADRFGVPTDGPLKDSAIVADKVDQNLNGGKDTPATV